MARVATTALPALALIALAGPPEPAAAARPRAVSSVIALQARLAELGYLAPAAISGKMGESSHGCVRIPLSGARTVYAFARLGISVDVDSG